VPRPCCPARGLFHVVALVFACAAAFLAALSLATPSRVRAAQPSGQAPRAAIVLAPSPRAAIKGEPFIQRIAEVPGLTAFGFVSAIQGPYNPIDVLLDLSAGNRTDINLYDGDPPGRIALVREGRARRIAGWPQVVARAATAPADVKPGTLGQAVQAGGGTVAYAGVARSANREAIVAADRSGRVERVSLGSGQDVGRHAVGLWRDRSLLVVRLPSHAAGQGALRAILAARRPQDLVVVLQDPNVTVRRLLAVGAAGLEGGTALRSESTRTDGLVLTTDFAPTVLKRLGFPIPKAVGGEPIAARGALSVEDLVSFRKRLNEVGPRRWKVVVGGLAAAIALLGVACAGQWRRVGRAALLAALWLPSVLLATGAIDPAPLVELGIIGFASATLALLTDRLLPWPRGLVAPAAVTLGAHLLDLALGSSLIERSLLGPNPLHGARFYGIGNELEITLAVTTLLGLGAALVGASARAATWGFALGGACVTFLLSWGRLGADVGAALTLGLGVAAASVYAAGRGSWRSRVAIVLGAPALAVSLLAALDLATGGNAHFTRSVLRAGGLDELAQVAQRRFELSYRSLGRGLVGPLVLIAAIAVLIGIRNRKRLVASLEDLPTIRAGFYGALVATIGGALTNDSGPVIFLIGTTYLALAVGYFHCVPKPSEIPRRKARAVYSRLQ
jgi:hypothetical protein